jgi:DNA-binding IclR family transcriptional regulator
MTSKIASILEILSDGRWHALGEIRRMAKIDEAQLQPIMDFLKEYTFIMWDEAGKRVRLNKLAQEFLTQTSTA